MFKTIESKTIKNYKNLSNINYYDDDDDDDNDYYNIIKITNPIAFVSTIDIRKFLSTK